MDLNVIIDELLDIERPERYDAGDKEWRLPVYAAVEGHVTIAEARQIAAQQLVDRREAQATRKVNSLLREIGRVKQWPLDWLELAQRPIALGEERVRLDIASADDFEQFAIRELRAAAADFTARNLSCDGAQWVAEELRAHGWKDFGEAVTSVDIDEATP